MKFEGVMPALVTPLWENETVNTEVLQQLLNGLLAEGADGFYLSGATGEGLCLTPAQRRVLAETAIHTVQHKKPCIVHVASTDFREAVDFARYAENCGADAISAIPPLFYKYDENDVYNYYKTLAETVHIPLMIYYNPAAGFAINAKFAARMFEIDNITSIKWTSPDYCGMMELKNLTHGEMNIINGPDEMLLMGLNAGADAGIGTTYNFMLPLVRSVYDNFKSHNMEQAQQSQRKIAHIISSMRSYHTIAATRAMVEAKGYAVGNASFPLKRYDENQKKQIVADLTKAGWCG